MPWPSSMWSDWPNKPRALRHREWLSRIWRNLGELHAARSDVDKASKLVAAGHALLNARQIVRAMRVRIDVIAAIARSELAPQKLPALNHRIQELARDSALWVNQLVRLIVANKRP